MTRARRLSASQAARCETAKTPRCRCRCGGLLHGASRFDAAEMAWTMADDDPHHAGNPPPGVTLTDMMTAARERDRAERDRRESRVLLAMRPAQIQRIRQRWEAANPHMRGATVADVLQMLTDADSDLDLIESIPAADWPAHPCAGFAARALIWGRPLGEFRRLNLGELYTVLAKSDAAA